MGKLRDQMLVDLQLRGATARTQKTYLREVSNFAKYFNRSPKELGGDELKEYMLLQLQFSLLFLLQVPRMRKQSPKERDEGTEGRSCPSKFWWISAVDIHR